jgi:hypothetical protein
MFIETNCNKTFLPCSEHDDTTQMNGKEMVYMEYINTVTQMFTEPP